LTGKEKDFSFRHLRASDLETLLNMDWRGLPKERFTIYLLFCVHFNQTSLVAESGGRTVGVLIGSTDADSTMGFLNHIVVWKDWEGHGIGRQLIDQWMDLLRKRGIKKVWLHGDLELYKQFGFEDSKDIFDPAIMDYYRKHDMKVLARDL
jgi:GNAT superfamily N-acetyltransferase